MSDIEQTVETALANAKETVEVDTKKALADAEAKFTAARTAAHQALAEFVAAGLADATRAKADAKAEAAKAKALADLAKTEAKAAKREFLAKFGFVKRLLYRVLYPVLKDFAKL